MFDRVQAKMKAKGLLRKRTGRDAFLTWILVTFMFVLASMLSFVAGPLLLPPLLFAGFITTSLRCVRGDETVEFADIFRSEKVIIRYAVVKLWKAMFLLLWCLPGMVILALGGFLTFMSFWGNSGVNALAVLLDIIGLCWIVYITIRKQLEYSMVYLIAEDNHEISAFDCIGRSRQMTEGHLWDLCVCYLSFIGWYILDILTIGIVRAYSIPYRYLTMAEVYCQLGGRAESKTVYGPADSAKKEFPQPEAEHPHYIEFITGEYAGSRFPIKDEETLTIGRDPLRVNIVVSGKYTTISHVHCSIRRTKNSFLVSDFSQNGTSVGGNKLTKDQSTYAQSGTVVSLADDAVKFRLM